MRAALPEIGTVNPYCHNDPGFVTRVSGLAAYTIPRVDVSVSGTFRSDPGLPLNGQLRGAQRRRRASRSAARSSGNAANVTVNLIEPGRAVGRSHQRDRPARRQDAAFGRTRTNVGLDIYNVMNSSAVLTYNQTFVPGGSWLTPLQVLTPRFVKFSAQVDF